VSTALWVLHLINVLLLAVVFSSPGGKLTVVAFPFVFLEKVAYFGIGYSVLALVDRNGGVIRLIGFLFFGVGLSPDTVSGVSDSRTLTIERITTENSIGTEDTTTSVHSRSQSAVEAEVAGSVSVST
jgi:hypothetical protein